jgi:hypothetical protein
VDGKTVKLLADEDDLLKTLSPFLDAHSAEDVVDSEFVEYLLSA